MKWLGFYSDKDIWKYFKQYWSQWFVRQLMKIRRRIETVIGQLVDYFEIERIRTQDTWHLTSRIARKLLGSTVGIYLNIQVGNEPTQFEWLITT